MGDDFWVDSLVALLEALERAFGPGPTVFEFVDDEEDDP